MIEALAQEKPAGKGILPHTPIGLVLSSHPQRTYRFSRFQLDHVARSTAGIIYADVCKETCKSPTPTTCKLECHSGAPLTEMQEEIPE